MSQCQEKSNLASKLGNWHGRGQVTVLFQTSRGSGTVEVRCDDQFPSREHCSACQHSEPSPWTRGKR